MTLNYFVMKRYKATCQENINPGFILILLFMIIIPGQTFGQLPDKLPDLVVSNLYWSPDTFQVGDSVWFQAEITNIGEAATPAKIHGVRFTVNGDAIGCTSDFRSSLDPGESFIAVPDITCKDVDSGYWVIRNFGEYEIEVEVDDYCLNYQEDENASSYCTQKKDPRCNNRICESNEDNNIYSVIFNLEGIFEYEKKADLIITSVTMEPENPDPGDDVIFSAIVKNQGDTVATSKTGYFGVNFMFGETRVSRTAFDKMMTSLGPGESTIQTANWSLEEGASDGVWKAAAGDTVLTALVDKDDDVKEFIETNNTFNKTMYIGVHDSVKKADLVVGDIFFDPPDPVPGQLVFFSADIVNQGQLYTQPVEKDHTINMEFTSGGLHASRTIHEEQIKDSIPSGDTVRIYGNQVDSDLERDGGWFSKNPGDYIITCFADKWGKDGPGKIAESDETNNTFSKRITVMPKLDLGPLPDLEITSLSWEPSEPDPGDSISFTVGVKNSGTVATPEDRLYKAKLSVFDTILYNKSENSIQAGGTIEFEMGKTIVPEQVASNEVTVAVDTFPWFSIIEITKSNNVITGEISSLVTNLDNTVLGDEMKIFPNPAHDRVNLQVQTTRKRQQIINVVNLAGQIVFSDLILLDPGINRYSIYTGNLPSGMYFVVTDLGGFKLLIRH
jgi:hypothetical protein